MTLVPVTWPLKKPFPSYPEPVDFVNGNCRDRNWITTKWNRVKNESLAAVSVVLVVPGKDRFMKLVRVEMHWKSQSLPSV